MAIVLIAPWLTGLQVIALLVTGDLECTAESLRREGDSGDARRLLTADEARTRARRMLAEMLADPDADKTREGLEKYLASVLPDRPPAYEVAGDGSQMNRAERLAVFKGHVWAWGGPSLRNLELQCGAPSLVSEAVQILSNAAPRLGSCDQHRRPTDPALWTTHHIEEQPEGFLQLVRPGLPGRPPVGSGIVPSFRTSDVLRFIRHSLRSNPRFSDAVSLADRLADDGTLARLGELSPDPAAVSKRVPARRGAPARALQAAKDGLRLLYGDVVPPDATETEMEARLAELGIRVSGTTIRRALGRRASGK
jgi:hypothetical protein